MQSIVEARSYYPDVSILPDSVLVAKILILSAKLYNLHYGQASADLAQVTDALSSLYFYVSALGDRYKIQPPTEKRHQEYNEPFKVSALLNAKDLAALILSKAMRLHSVFHGAGAIHIDSVADLLGYLSMLASV